MMSILSTLLFTSLTALVSCVKIFGSDDFMSNPNIRLDLGDYPTEINDLNMCQACHAMIHEVSRNYAYVDRSKMTRRQKLKLETEIFDLLDGICRDSTFMMYSPYPRNMVANCHEYMSEYNSDNQVELRLLKEGDYNSWSDDLCGDICEDVPYTERLKMYAPETNFIPLQDKKREYDEAKGSKDNIRINPDGTIYEPELVDINKLSRQQRAKSYHSKKKKAKKEQSA